MVVSPRTPWQSRIARKLAILALLPVLAASCTDSKKKINADPVKPVTTLPGAKPGAGNGKPQTGGNAVKPNNDAAVGAGLPQNDAEKGRLYVNGWTGHEDEAAAGGKWTISTKPTPTLPNASGTVPPTPTQPGVTPGTQPGVTPPPATPTPGTQPGVTPPPATGDGPVVFHIKKGTGSGAWNTAETEAVLKVGKPFTIVNDDDVVHQWHTNGSPCPHGDEIAPGQSETCTPDRKFSEGPLYDHISEGSFHVRAE